MLGDADAAHSRLRLGVGALATLKLTGDVDDPGVTATLRSRRSRRSPRTSRSPSKRHSSSASTRRACATSGSASERTEEGERKRLAERERVLQSEYRCAEKLGGADVLRIVDDEMQDVGPRSCTPRKWTTRRSGSPRARLPRPRSREEGDQQLRDGRRYHGGDQEGCRSAGSSWNDEERAKWSEELDQAAVNAYERELGKPRTSPSAPSRACTPIRPSLLHGAVQGGTRPALDSSAHRQRLRDANVEHWEQTEGRRIRGRVMEVADRIRRWRGGATSSSLTTRRRSASSSNSWKAPISSSRSPASMT